MDVPEQLQATKDLLIHSLPSHSREQAPPVQQELMKEFVDRFGRAHAAPASKVSEEQFIDRVRRFFASPAFGLAAAAVLLLGLLVPQLVDRSRDVPETFRATSRSTVSDRVPRIVFIGEAPEFDSEVLDPTSLVSANDLESALFELDPKVVIDFNADTLSVFNRDGETTFTGVLPKSPEDLPAAIAAALTQL